MSTNLAPPPMPPAAQQQLADAQSSTPYNTRDAALKGASLAFGKPAVAPKPRVNTYSGNNGALAAARQSSTPQPQLLRPQDTGNSSTSQLSQTSHLGLPAVQSGRARSPSVIAASLAAQRRTPASDTPDTRRRGMMDSSNNTSNDSLPGAGTVSDIKAKFNGSAAALPSGAKPSPARPSRPPSRASESTDATSIPPTTSLVKMFEQNKSAATTPTTPTRSSKPTPILTSRGGPPPLKSPKPTRNITVPFTSPEQPKPDTSKPRPVSAGNIAARKPKPAPKPTKFLGDVQKTSPHVSPKVPPKPTFTTSTREIPPPAKDDSDDDDDDDAAYMSAPETQTDNRVKPAVPPPRRGTKRITKDHPSNDGTTDMSRPAPTARLRRHSATGGTSSAPPAETRTLLPPPPISSSYKRSYMKTLEPHMTGESLANAMVGAALAGSRVSTPASQSKSPIPPPPRRSGNHHHHHHHHPHLFHSSRETSPNKKPGKLMPTLRKEPSSSDSESDRDGRPHQHKKTRHLRPKHPNKHAEGARRRWRDAIAEREKKRYEGVWAANRGLHLAPHQLHPSVLASVPDPAELRDEVVNFVVRDIWGRSRLPPQVLEEVWELVDGRGVGRLRREEFVVGMWLIDQVLKGKKLPVRVQDSVWASVRGAGVRVRIR